jgi:hypothetical protein
MEAIKPKSNRHGEFRCNICNKVFSRKDVATRHKKLVHFAPRTPKVSKRKSCQRCVSSKLKCSGGIQCDNCRKRGIQCEFNSPIGAPEAQEQPLSGTPNVEDVLSPPIVLLQEPVNQLPVFDLDSLSSIDWLRFESVEFLPLVVEEVPCSLPTPETVEDNWPFSYQKSPENPSVVLPPLSQVIGNKDNSSLRSEFTNLLSLPYKSHPWPFHEVKTIESFFPSSAIVQEFINLFFARWYNVSPIIHRPSWSMDTAPCLLMATMISIGAGFSDRPDAHTFADNLSELTKRTIHWQTEKDRNYLRKEYFLTAMLLQSIYALGSGNKCLYEVADSARALLVTNARGSGMFNLKFEDFGPDNWVAYERKKRVVWLLFEYDCTICTLTSSRPCMSLHDLNNNLPCDEDVWEGRKPWKDGPSFRTTISDILQANRSPDLNSYSRRLVCQALGRSLWDYVELDSTIVFKTIGVSESPQNQLLQSLRLLQGYDSKHDEIVHVTMSCMIVSYSHLYGHHSMDLVTSATRDADSTKLNMLKTVFAKDPSHTRFLAWQAAQIVSVVKHAPIHAPCETMRVFMAGLFLYWFCKLMPSVDSGATITRLDTLPWEGYCPSEWIENGGLACIADRNEFVKINGPDCADRVIDVILGQLRGLKVWGLAEKFCVVLNRLKEMTPGSDNITPPSVCS